MAPPTVTGVMAVATVAYCIGGCLIGGAGIFVLLNLGDYRELRTLRRVVPSPIAAKSGGRVAFEGRTTYGHGGVHLAPVTGEGCAWYRVRLVREPGRHSAGSDGPTDDVLLDVTSPGGFALADHSGRVAVDPAILEHRSLSGPRVLTTTELVHRRKEPVPLPPVVPRHLVDDLRKSERLILTEERVPPDVPVYALGRLAHGLLKPNRVGLSVFTTDSRAQAIAARKDDIAMGAKLIVGFGVSGLLLAAAGLGYLATLT